MAILEQDSLVERLYSKLSSISGLEIRSDLPVCINSFLNNRKKPRTILIRGSTSRQVRKIRRDCYEVRFCSQIFRFKCNQDCNGLEANIGIYEAVLDMALEVKDFKYYESRDIAEGLYFNGNLRMDRVEEAFLRRRVNWAGEISVFGIRYGVGKEYSDDDVFVYFKMDPKKRFNGNLYLFNSDGEFVMPVYF